VSRHNPATSKKRAVGPTLIFDNDDDEDNNKERDRIPPMCFWADRETEASLGGVL
jgi:hypothetical protein